MYQLYVISFIVIFYSPYIALNMTIMNHCCWAADITIFRVQQLDSILDDKDDREAAKILRNALIAKKLKMILNMTYRMIDYHDRVQTLLQLKFFVSLNFFSFLICMTLFTLKSGIFSVLLLLLALGQNFMYCWMGNRVIVHYEALTSSLYGMKWYLMNVKHQKDFQLILLRTQAMRGLNGIFKTASLETFQRVC